MHLVTGNHDDRESLLDTFGGTPWLGDGFSAYYLVDHSAATVVVLDSLVPGASGGRLGEEQLGWLDGVLAGRPDVPALVFLHHPRWPRVSPPPTRSGWPTPTVSPT